MNSAPVKIALAGIGGYGESYLDALLPKDRTAAGTRYELLGVVDPLPHRCRRIADLRARNIPIYPSIQSLYAATGTNGNGNGKAPAPAIDLMMIATPIHLHAPHTCF